MKIIILFLLCGIIVIADCTSTRKEIHSYQLENKIIKGRPARSTEYRFMASLQLSGNHVCSSGIFQKGFLLTTSECAWHIGYGIVERFQKATAVLGGLDLKTGQRIDIYKVAYFLDYHHFDYRIGIIMLTKKVDYTNVQILNLKSERVNSRTFGLNAVVCGWGARDDLLNDYFGHAEYSECLLCMPIHLYSIKECQKLSKKGDYKRRLLCGMGIYSEQTPSLGDIGSPLTKSIEVDGEVHTIFIGVTLRMDILSESKVLRFARFSSVLNDTRYIMEQLETPIEELSA